uniref:G-protein coupled receptors family 1 profile domain-containing protein n=1 Tax=Xiphophorus couchianus TaxID=32473 RepID=A0A3B5KQJ2_9TELE
MNSTLLSCSSNSSVEQHMYPTVYSLFFIVGFPANCLSLFVAWKLALQGNNMAVYLVSLCVSDLLYTVTLPVWIGMAQRWNVSDQLCGVMYLIMYNSFYVGSGLLCCISVDRYLAVVYPLHFHWVREVRAAALLSAAVWLLEIFLHIVLLHHMGALQSFNLCHQPMPLTWKDANVALVRVVVSFLFPLVVMTTHLAVKANRATMDEEQLRISKLLTMVLLCLLVCFGPIHVAFMVRMLLDGCEGFKWFLCIYKVSTAISTMNCLADPLLYCFITRTGQENIQQVLLFFLRKQKRTEGINCIS